ncbi:uncharacterized protein LOC121410083 isoform X2 [Lytechinus variegatus]|uniref:uncharacterized protein LOC121410083 isoform X2 n=1 Tax=Lytechinus variegatus TaxID=7654 RepID=UPI001BB29706|nr:uncharacterized protein LOC121410083 isoform X2 [Lytechinus variegatus]
MNMINEEDEMSSYLFYTDSSSFEERLRCLSYLNLELPREKAQEQLRTRMRQRINGNGNSSTLIHNKRSSSVLGGSGDTSLSPRMKHSSSMEVTPRDLQGNNFWRTQQDRYNTLTGIQPTEMNQAKTSPNQSVPLQELVDKVLHRKEQNFDIGSNFSPMTIRAYKPPCAPYAMQQSPHVKKIVKMKPIQRSDRDDKGPFVLVLHRNGGDETQGQLRGRRRDRSKIKGDVRKRDISDEVKLNTTVTSSQILPPLSDIKSPSDLKTWRPALDAVHQSKILPEAEDRSVTNYRLQMQHASKLAEARFEFQHQGQSNQTVEEMTMQTLNPLPPIQSVYPADGSEGANNDTPEVEAKSSQPKRTKNEQNLDRTSSKSEILNLKKAQKEAKRQKQVESEEFTLLRTRKRFTNKTKQFKSDLERARQLSAIAEDRSSLNSSRLRNSSGRQLSFSSSSSNSLNRIHEGSVSNSPMIQDDLSKSNVDESDYGKFKGIEQNLSIGLEPNNNAIPLAPPTSPSVESQWDSSVIMNVNIMKSNLNESSDSPSKVNGQKLPEHAGGAATSCHDIVSHETKAVDDMIWVEGDLPFHGSTAEHLDTTTEYTR